MHVIFYMMWKYEIVVYIFEVFFSIIQLVAALVLFFEKSLPHLSALFFRNPNYSKFPSCTLPAFMVKYILF